MSSMRSNVVAGDSPIIHAIGVHKVYQTGRLDVAALRGGRPAHSAW